MKYFFTLLILFTLFACTAPESIEHPDVEIARDQWGVPHIHGSTDADAVYGLAWAQCEDDFVTLQEQILAAKGMLGQVKGKDGLVVDFAIKFMQLREEVDKRYAREITGKHQELLHSFVSAVNTYARLHPKEAILADAYPITDRDLLVAYQLGIVDITGAGSDLQKIMSGKIKNDLAAEAPTGSNAIAISKRKTTNGKTFLAINSHQPLEGWYSWYEAHLSSNEGLNILGGTFPGGIMIFHGVNEDLGWAHTVNHADFSDVYKLRMHEQKKEHYYFDGEVLPLKKKKYWSWMKIAGPLKIPISRTIYESVYGPTFKTDGGYFAWRFVASRGLRMSEQWFAMDKAQNFKEFMAALEMQAIPSTNIVYADKEDNIFYISNGKIPQRNHNYSWDKVLPGDTSATLWQEKYYPLAILPQVANPSSGFIFNTNNSPFNATDSLDDPLPGALNGLLGFQDEDLYNNRSKRFLELISLYDSVSYNDFKKIKFDDFYPSEMASPYYTNLELLVSLDPHKYSDISDAITLLQSWDRQTNVENTIAPLFFIAFEFLDDIVVGKEMKTRGGTIAEADCAKAITLAKEKLLNDYGSLEISLGDIQRHIRGDVNLPLGGGPDVLAAMYWKDMEDGHYKGIAGESYIMLAQFDSAGTTLETINAYGSSAEPGSPHYTDQMELYVRRKLKPMSLDIDKAFAEADTIYRPLMLKE